MSNATTNHRRKKIPTTAAGLLRRDRGALARIARRLGVSPSHVSKTLSGARRSERVRLAITRECLRLARLYDSAAFATEYELARR